MAEYLFIAFAVATTLDIVALGLTASFFDRGFSIGKFIVRFMVTSLVVALLALGGVLLGQIGTHYVDSSTCMWLASSLMFLLSVKAVYDGLKTAKLKRSINPTVFSGLLSLSVLAGINTFLYSLGFGLMNVDCGVVLWFFPLFLVALILSSLIGRKQTRLHHIYNGWIFALVALFGAIYTVVVK